MNSTADLGTTILSLVISLGQMMRSDCVSQTFHISLTERNFSRFINQNVVISTAMSGQVRYYSVLIRMNFTVWRHHATFITLILPLSRQYLQTFWNFSIILPRTSFKILARNHWNLKYLFPRNQKSRRWEVFADWRIASRNVSFS